MKSPPSFPIVPNGYMSIKARMTRTGNRRGTMTHLTRGVDISKDWLDIHLAPTGETRRFPNRKAGFRSLLGWLEAQPAECIVHEPTGRWHRDFEQALIDAGLPLARVNPLQARVSRRRWGDVRRRLLLMPVCWPKWGWPLTCARRCCLRHSKAISGNCNSHAGRHPVQLKYPFRGVHPDHGLVAIPHPVNPPA